VARRRNFKKNKNGISGRNNKRPIKFNIGLPEEVKGWIWGALSFLIAVIIILSFFNKAGIAGQTLIWLLAFLIGKAAFIIPLALVLGGIAFFMGFRENSKLIVLTVLISIFGVSGFLSSISPGTDLGGKIGYFSSYPFLRFLGPIVSEITFALIILISGLLFWYLFGRPSFSFKETETSKELGKKDEKKEGSSTFIKKIFEPKFKVKEVPSAPPDAFLEKKEEDYSSGGFLKKKLEEGPSSESIKTDYNFPPTDLLEKDKGKALAGDIKVNSAIIKRTLQNFDIDIEMSDISVGPTVTRYALKPAEGVKLSRITVLSNDLSMALASHPIRIEAPIPGRPLVGIEIPNKTRTVVRMRELVEHPQFQNAETSLTLCLGRDVSGKAVFANLDKMPHLLVAGATGTGKTICLSSIILSLLYKNSPESLKLILIDPKRVEFPVYNELPHLMCPVIYSAQKAINVLKWLTEEMERRFDVLSQARTKDIKSFNRRYFENPEKFERLPYIVLIIDELADLMAARGREMEAGIVRLAQMARAVGIHLILATQRPSVEVITGLIKANITSRITFQVASQVDSRTILDMAGAERLLGFGDMLFISAEKVKPRRIQGVFASEDEVKKVVRFITSNTKPEEKEDVSKEIKPSPSKSLNDALEGGDFLEDDPMYEEAKRVVIESRKASSSLLQRRLRIGYARAARLIDTLEERGVVGPGEGAKPRDVYIDEGEGLE